MYQDSQQKNQGFSNNPHDKSIIIKVHSPQLDSVKGHYTYLVSGQDKNGPFEIRRRFNDFYYLRQSLKKIYTSLYIPPVPEKMLTGNKDEGNIQIRKKFFNLFMKKISDNHHTFYNNITQDFLRNKNIDMQKIFTTTPTPKPTQIIQLLTQIYPQIINTNKPASLEQRQLILQFSVYLKKADKQLRNIKSTVQSIVQARNHFLQNLSVCTLSILPEYQKNVYSEYVPVDRKQDNLIFAKNIKVQQNAKKLKQNSTQNPFQLTLDMITYEIREIQAMNQLMNDKQSYQSNFKKSQQKLSSSQSQLLKLSVGKTTFKSFFSKGNKQQQIKILQKQIPIMKKQLQKLKQFINYIYLIIAEKEIPNFKMYKKMKYYQMVNITSEKQLNHLSVYGEMMKSVMQSAVAFK